MVNYIKSLFSSVKSVFSNAKYVVTISEKNSQYYFNLNAKNGETILSSEGYVTKQGVMSGISSVRVNGLSRDNFEIKKASDDKWFFILKAKNHEVIGKSETYNDYTSAIDGIDSVMGCCSTDITKFDLD